MISWGILPHYADWSSHSREIKQKQGLKREWVEMEYVTDQRI